MHSTVALIFGLTIITRGFASFLDPNVFRNLASLPLPPVKNSYNIQFNFTTEENILQDANAFNATYASEVMTGFDTDSRITLFIPLPVVNMRGLYHSTIAIPIPGGDPIVQHNSGNYALSLRDVHLTFTIAITFSLNGARLALVECHPKIDEVRMRLLPSGRRPPRSRISLGAVRDFLNLISKQEYESMFCNAMSGLLDDHNSPIIRAVFSRMQESFYSKSLFK